MGKRRRYFGVHVKRQGNDYCLFVGKFLVCRHDKMGPAYSCLKNMTNEVHGIVESVLRDHRKRWQKRLPR